VANDPKRLALAISLCAGLCIGLAVAFRLFAA
jgi:hypothetical protein